MHTIDVSTSVNNGVDYSAHTTFVATVKLTPPVCVKQPDSFEDGGVYFQYTRIPSGVSVTKLARALHDTIGSSNCNHAYDCCGCPIRRVNIKRMGRQLQIRTCISYNY